MFCGYPTLKAAESGTPRPRPSVLGVGGGWLSALSDTGNGGGSDSNDKGEEIPGLTLVLARNRV